MKALLVVDVQNGLMNKKIFNKEIFTSTIKAALENYRNKNGHIIFIQHNNKSLVSNTTDWAIFNEFETTDKDIIIQKHHADAFDKTGLADKINGIGIDEILVCGLVSNGCVRATCIGGIKAKMRVQLLKKGHSTWTTGAQGIVEKTEKELSSLGIELVEI